MCILFIVMQCFIILEIKMLYFKQVHPNKVKDVQLLENETSCQMKDGPWKNSYSSMKRKTGNIAAYSDEISLLSKRPDDCTNYKIFLLIFVLSATTHYEKRNSIRDTWASVTEFHQKQISTVFILGETNNTLLQEKINAEKNTHGDIIQGKFIDPYRNLTHKHITGLEWVTKYCNNSKFVLKVDDDTFVNIFRMVHLLQSYQNKTGNNQLNKVIYCYPIQNAYPKRKSDNKHYVSSEEYSVSKYPKYCSGFAYFTTTNLIIRLYKQSLVTPQGILAEKLNVTQARPKSALDFSIGVKRRNIHKFLIIYGGYQKLRDLERIWPSLWSKLYDTYRFEM